MRYSVNIPNFGDFADPRTVATVARAAEEAGWDGLFVWDHVVHNKEMRRGLPFGDPWMLLTAAALATSRIRLGTLVTPVARRRPEQLARQVATLDAVSGGRVIFGAGLGGPIEDEFGSFGDADRPVGARGELDEGLGLLARYWAGERVDHDGTHYRVRGRELLRRRCSGRGRRCGWAGSGRTADRSAARPGGTASCRCSRPRGTAAAAEAGRGAKTSSAYVAEQRGQPAASSTSSPAGARRRRRRPTSSGRWPRPGRPGGTSAGCTRQPDLHSRAAVLRRVEAGPPRP